IDSFFTLLILLSLWSLTEKRFEIASAILVYALLVKPQAFFFFPILLFALVEKKNLKTFFLSVISGLLVFFVVVFPFSSGRGIFWIVDKYTETLSSYPYAALNAFNLFALSGGNWVNENNPFLFLSYRVWGYIFLLTIFLVTAVLFFRWKDRFKVYPLSFFLVASVFILSSKMHERYLYPALALALFCYVYYRDRRIFTTYLGFSVTHFLNVGLVLLYSWYNIFHLYRYDLSVLFISLTNVILYVYALFIGGDLFREGQGKKRMKREL
ncbi:MAG: phospholipid carrier-dependent glycosyltransferase, partial [Candidatus Atribacteria bacterium]|nr:phospholipid carrier-dependent glycosyltransferase [Candidatus Atribacteria bacterium]